MILDFAKIQMQSGVRQEASQAAEAGLISS